MRAVYIISKANINCRKVFLALRQGKREWRKFAENGEEGRARRRVNPVWCPLPLSKPAFSENIKDGLANNLNGLIDTVGLVSMNRRKVYVFFCPQKQGRENREHTRMTAFGMPETVDRFDA